MSRLLLAFIVCLLCMTACREIEVTRSENDFPDTMSQIQTILSGKGYSIIRIQALDQGLGKAGYKINRYRIIFFGKANDFKAIQDRHPGFTVFLPLSVTVYEDNGKTYLQSMPFEAMQDMALDQKQVEMISRWRTDIVSSIHQAAKPAF